MTALGICVASVAVLIASTNAFVLKPAFSPSKVVLSSVAELDPIDLMCIEDVAEFCLGRGSDECSADDMIATENQLEDQTHILHDKIDDINGLLFRLRSELGVKSTEQPINPLSPRISYKNQLSPIDLQCIENVAEFCLGRGKDQCSLEDADALVNQLKDQRDILTVEAYNVDALLKKLHARNSVFAADGDDISSLLGSIDHALTMDEVPEVGPAVETYDIP